MQRSSNDIFSEPNTSDQAVVDGITKRRERLQLYQSESHKMKSLLMNSAGLRNGLSKPEATVNPLWVNFPTQCVKQIGSTEELREKLHYFSKSDEVMVVRYTQNNCTACNAVGKVFEFLCHQSEERTPNLHFYEVNRHETPDLTKGLVRFPQVKGFSGGQWTDIDFKPPSEFREELYGEIEREVKRRKFAGTPVTALEAEEMYFSAAGPAMLEIMEENLTHFYCKAQVRLHNYWKQVSVRRAWFYKKFLEPQIEQDVRDEWQARSVLGEKVLYGPKMPDDFA